MNQEKTISILAAEDNFVNQKLLEKIFSIPGWNITIVSDGKRAIEEAVKINFDAILMDIRMPDIDGFEATTKIREFNKTVPIIAVTANAIIGFRDLCINAGMNDFITKPFRKEELFEIIEQQIKFKVV